MEKKFCSQCRSLLSEGDKICSVCGFETDRISEPKTIIRYPTKSKPEQEQESKPEEVISKNEVQAQEKPSPQPEADEESKLKNTAEEAESFKAAPSDSGKEKDEKNDLHNDFEIPVRVPTLRKSVYNKTLPAWDVEDNFIDDDVTASDQTDTGSNTSKNKIITKVLLAVGIAAVIFASAVFFMPKARSIKTEQTSMELIVEDISKIEYSVTPQRALAFNPKWATSDANVAVVKNGVVTAVGEGECNITIMIDNAAAQIPVTVLPKPESIKISGYNDHMFSGSTQLLNYNVSPENANKIMPKFESSDTTVATVSKGQITAVSAGECDISLLIGSLKETIHITVLDNIDSIEFDDHNIDIVAGETKQLNYSVAPPEAKTLSPTFSSSNNEIAAVDSKGKITGIAKGTCDIKVAVNDKEDVVKVNVISAVESILLSQDYTVLKNGEQKQLTFTCEPADASNYEPVWSSSDEKIAKVSYNGKVTAVSGGNAVITVSVGDVSASSIVYVLSDEESEKVNAYTGTWKSFCKSSIDVDDLEHSLPLESMLFLKDDNTFFLNIDKTDYKGMFAPYSGYLDEDVYFDGLLLYSDDVLFLCNLRSFDDGDYYLSLIGIDGETGDLLDTVYYYTRD